MELPGFIGASYRQTALEVDVEDTVNLYPEIMESPGAKKRMILYGSPGLTAYKAVGLGPIRGLLDVEGWTSIVSGNTYFRLKPDGTYDPTSAGANGTVIANDSMPVTMVADTTQVMIVSAGVVYVHTSTGVAPVANPPWTLPVDGALIDGYFIVLDAGSQPVGGQFFVSALHDATTWNALNFSTSPSSNNKLLALATDHDELWLFGSRVTQPFYNNQNSSGVPFVANQTAIIMQGIATKTTRANLDNTLFWLARNEYGTLQAFVADGYRPQRISTHAIEQQWFKYANGLDCTAWVYQLNGHPTYHLNFNTDQRSWRYDRATGLWHRVAYRNTNTNQGQAHLGNCHCVRLGQHIVGDRTSGQLWILDPAADSDGGAQLVAMRRAPAIFAGNKLVYYKLFELITPVGIGDGTLNTPQSNPAWMLRWSNDNGNTWSNEYQLAAGAQGNYGTRLRKVGVGAGRNRVFEVSISAAVPRALISAEIEAEVGLS